VAPPSDDSDTVTGVTVTAGSSAAAGAGTQPEAAGPRGLAGRRRIGETEAQPQSSSQVDGCMTPRRCLAAAESVADSESECWNSLRLTGNLTRKRLSRRQGRPPGGGLQAGRPARGPGGGPGAERRAGLGRRGPWRTPHCMALLAAESDSVSGSTSSCSEPRARACQCGAPAAAATGSAGVGVVPGSSASASYDRNLHFSSQIH
jgi:hypothetical protein